MKHCFGIKLLGDNYCVQLKNALTAKEITLSRETLALHAEMYHGVPILWPEMSGH